MMPVPAVVFTTSDGVERQLRFTLGARKRIADRFGVPDLKAVLERWGDGALPWVAYAMMYDTKGRPPAGLDPDEFAESLADPIPLLAAVMSAAEQGRTPKNEYEALLRAAQQTQSIGPPSGPSLASASTLLRANSGPAPSASSTPSASDGGSPSAPETSEPA